MKTTKEKVGGKEREPDKARAYFVEEPTPEETRKPRTPQEMAAIARLVAALRSTLGDAPVPRMIELADGHEFLDTMLIWLRNEAYIRKSYATSARVQRHRARKRHEQALRETTPTAAGSPKATQQDVATELDEARALRAAALETLRLATELLTIQNKSSPGSASE